MSDTREDAYQSISPDIDFRPVRVRFNICERPSPTGDEMRKPAEESLLRQLLEGDKSVSPSDYESPPKEVRHSEYYSMYGAEAETETDANAVHNASLEGRVITYEKSWGPQRLEGERFESNGGDQAEKQSSKNELDDTNASATTMAKETYQAMSSTARQDSKGFLICNPGEMLEARYTIEAKLGQGGFGRVYRVHDKMIGTTLAMKIIRQSEKPAVAGYLEVRNLIYLREIDPLGRNLCLMMNDWFEYKGHKCITYDLMGLSIFDFLKQNAFHPYDLDHIRHITYQLCHATKFLHANQVTHTDIKLDNILLVDSSFTSVYDDYTKRVKRRLNRADIRLIDFGLATFDREYHSSIIQTRPYRAPEICLELPWSHPSDVWSMAVCILEIYVGGQVFNLHNNLQHLAQMEHMFGPIPGRLIREHKAKVRPDTKYFHVNGLVNINKQSEMYKYIMHNSYPLARYQWRNTIEHRELFSMLKMMFMVDPRERLKMSQAKNHPFFKRLEPILRLL